MFDFGDMFDWGREVEIKGKKWLLLKGLAQPGFYLAVEADTTLPSPVMVIYVDRNDTTGKCVEKAGKYRHNA